MVRLLLILSLIFYVLYKLGIFRAFTQSTRGQQGFDSKSNNGNIHVDNAPPKEKKPTGFKGGEYVDYEEIK